MKSISQPLARFNLSRLSSSPFLADVLTYFVIPCVLAIFNILKVLVMPRCLAFDRVDDAMHTFVNLSLVQESLKNGEMPFMNLYNNFGTPLIGDALSYPFAVQAVPYWILPFDWAMTLNRFILGFSTIWILIYFYRKYFCRFISVICAVLVMYQAGFFWHFAHHPYQMSILFFILILILQEKFINFSHTKYYICLCLCFVLLVLSVSFNVVIIMIPFFILHHLYLNGWKLDSKFLLFVSAVLSGFLFSWPDTLSLFQNLQNSYRIADWHPFPNKHIRFLIPVIVMTFLGMGYLLRSRSPQLKFLPIFVLGILPLYIILFILNYPAVWRIIPFLRSTDISRLLWFSIIFMMLGTGRCMEALLYDTRLKKNLIFVIWIFCLVDVYFIALEEIKDQEMYYVPILIVLLCFMPFLLILVKNFKDENMKRSHSLNVINYYSIGITLLLLQFFSSTQRILGYDDFTKCRAGFHFSAQGDDRYFPSSFVKLLNPFSRLATEYFSGSGYELKLNRDHIFTSEGRSIIINKKFGQFLMKNEMIQIDQIPTNYHFKAPWYKEKLSALGIRYVVQPGVNAGLMKEGWKILTEFNGWYLYENPLDTCLIYLLDEKNTKTCLSNRDVSFGNSHFKITLPRIQAGQELVATFLALPDWKLFIDNKRREIYRRDDQLIRAQVIPGDRSVLLKFEPYQWYHFAGGIVLSILIPLGAFLKFRHVFETRHI